MSCSEVVEKMSLALESDDYTTFESCCSEIEQGGFLYYREGWLVELYYKALSYKRDRFSRRLMFLIGDILTDMIGD